MGKAGVGVDSKTPCLTLLEGITFVPWWRGWIGVTGRSRRLACLTGNDRAPCMPHVSFVSTQIQGKNPRKCTNPTIHPGGAYLGYHSSALCKCAVMEFDCL